MTDVLLAEYRIQPVVRSRNSSALLRWAAYVAALPLPATKPSEDFARSHIVASRMPEQIDSYVQRCSGYFAQDPDVANDINVWLNAFNTPAVEEQLSTRNSAIVSGFIDRFAATDVTQEQIDQWYLDHGYA